MNEKLLNAIERLIKKYSSKTFKGTGAHCCSLCALYLYINCQECPNSFFAPSLGCVARSKRYSELSYDNFQNYPTLKQFWTDYRELYLTGLSNEEIMSKLIVNFKEK